MSAYSLYVSAMKSITSSAASRLRWLLPLYLLLTAQDYGSGIPTVWTQPSSAAVACTDYTTSANLICLWDLEEASGTRVCSAGTCADAGSDCDLTDTNTTGQNTVDFQEGAASADFENTNNEDLRCGDGTCDELDQLTAVSFGGWLQMESVVGSGRDPLWNFTSGAGYMLRVISSFSAPQCRVNDSFETGFTSFVPADGFVHFVCTHDNDADNEIILYRDGAEDCSAGCNTLNADMASDTSIFFLSRAASTDWDGEMDEMFVHEGELTPAQVCYICSCQWDGTRCTGVAGSPPTNSGRNVAECGSCTLPNCDAAAP